MCDEGVFVEGLSWIKSSQWLCDSLKRSICMHPIITFIPHANAFDCRLHCFKVIKHTIHVHTNNYYRHNTYKPLQKNLCLRIKFRNTTTYFSMYVKRVFHSSNLQHAYKQIIPNMNPKVLKFKSYIHLTKSNGPCIIVN